ncbi:unnamed protein product [Penicillium roqueforti FM164]|uniref:Uncharacterized protein n=1 Tax=Penicillium roqueforti (strain FM164) TaxID=1365484 RepID=W6QNR8_PENRF|nr:unnamed protein product [Penicillium roqueforti FM164]
MPDKGKKRVAQWCTFCEIEGHTQEECHRWAACLRDTAMANNISMMAAYKPSQNQKTNPHKKTHRSYRGGQNRTARNNLPPRPSSFAQSGM